MTPLEKQEGIIGSLRAGFQRERDNGFVSLRRIPSTHVRKFLDYFSALDESEQDDLAEGLAERAFFSMFPERSESVPLRDRNPAWKLYVDALPLMWHWRYEDVRGLQMRLQVARLEPESSLALEVTPEIRKWIEGIQPVTSVEIRKLVKLGLSQIMTGLRVSHEAQLWQYRGNLNGTSTCVTIDYSGRYHQFEYWVSTQEHSPHFRGLNYESLMGLAFAHWNCLEKANLDPSIALLKEHVCYCAEFLRRYA